MVDSPQTPLPEEPGLEAEDSTAKILTTVVYARLSQALQEMLCILAQVESGVPGDSLAVWRARTNGWLSFARWLNNPKSLANVSVDDDNDDNDDDPVDRTNLATVSPWGVRCTEMMPAHASSLLSNVCNDADVPTVHDRYPNTVTHTFYKILPRCSQGRQFRDIILLKLSKDRRFSRECLRWMRSGLLGLYRHCGVRLTGRRVQEYFALIASPLSEYNLLIALLIRHKLVVMTFIREHLLFSVEQAPFLEQAFEDTFNFRDFQRKTVRTADRLRKLVNVAGWDVLFGPSLYTSDAWCAVNLDQLSTRAIFARARGEGGGEDAAAENSGPSLARPPQRKKRKRRDSGSQTTAPTVAFPDTSANWRALRRGDLSVQLPTRRGGSLGVPAVARRPAELFGRADKTDTVVDLSRFATVDSLTRQRISEWFQALRQTSVTVIPTTYQRSHDRFRQDADLGRQQKLGRIHSRVEGIRIFLTVVRDLSVFIQYTDFPTDYDQCYILYQDLRQCLTDSTLVAELQRRELIPSSSTPCMCFANGTDRNCPCSQATWPRLTSVVCGRELASLRLAAWTRLWEQLTKFCKQLHEYIKTEDAHPPPFPFTQWPLPRPLMPLRSGGTSSLLTFARPDSPTENGLIASRRSPPQSIGSSVAPSLQAVAAAVRKAMPQTMLQGDLHFLEEHQDELAADFYLNRNQASLLHRILDLLGSRVRHRDIPCVPAVQRRRILALVASLLERRRQRRDAPPPDFGESLPWLLCFGVDPRCAAVIAAFCLDLATGLARDAVVSNFVADIGEFSPQALGVWLVFVQAFDALINNGVETEEYSPSIFQRQCTKREDQTQLYVCDLCSAVFSSVPLLAATKGVFSLHATTLDFTQVPPRRLCSLVHRSKSCLEHGHRIFGAYPIRRFDLRKNVVRTSLGWYVLCFSPLCHTVLFLDMPRGSRSVAVTHLPQLYGDGLYCSTCRA